MARCSYGCKVQAARARVSGGGGGGADAWGSQAVTMLFSLSPFSNNALLQNSLSIVRSIQHLLMSSFLLNAISVFLNWESHLQIYKSTWTLVSFLNYDSLL